MRPRLQSRPLTAAAAGSDDGAGSAAATDAPPPVDDRDFQFGLEGHARAGASMLALGFVAEIGRPALRAGEAICVEPGSDAREYALVVAVGGAPGRPAGAGAGRTVPRASRALASVHVQLSRSLTFDHPAGTVVRKVGATPVARRARAARAPCARVPPRDRCRRSARANDGPFARGHAPPPTRARADQPASGGAAAASWASRDQSGAQSGARISNVRRRRAERAGAGGCAKQRCADDRGGFG